MIEGVWYPGLRSSAWGKAGADTARSFPLPGTTIFKGELVRHLQRVVYQNKTTSSLHDHVIREGAPT